VLLRADAGGTGLPYGAEFTEWGLSELIPCGGKSPKLKAIPDPWTTLRGAAEEIVVVKGFRIAGSALARACGEDWRP
jgi:hypothetical protein